MKTSSHFGLRVSTQDVDDWDGVSLNKLEGLIVEFPLFFWTSSAKTPGESETSSFYILDVLQKNNESSMIRQSSADNETPPKSLLGMTISFNRVQYEQLS